MDGQEKRALMNHMPQKVTRKRMDICSRSNILKKIIDNLENEQYRHMLYWNDKNEKEFTIKFVHMNNPECKNYDYLELFKDLDKLSNSYEKYLLDEKYYHKCKVRCKANLRKLVESKALTFKGKIYEGKSIQLRKYKLNSKVTSVKSAVSKCEQMTRESNAINLYVNVPVVGTSLCASPVEPSLLGNCCMPKNKDTDTINVMLQNQSLTVYEHEKQMDENYGALGTNYTESLNMESVESMCLPSCNNPVEALMGGIKLQSNQSTECYESQFRSNSLSGFENEGFQDMDGDSKNYAQLVPSSPLINERNFYDISHFSENYSHINKPLQQDEDPFWFPRISDCLNDSQTEEYECIMGNNEDSFSFEKSDAV